MRKRVSKEEQMIQPPIFYIHHVFYEPQIKCCYFTYIKYVYDWVIY